MKIQLEEKDWPDVFDDSDHCDEKFYACRFIRVRPSSFYGDDAICRLFFDADGDNIELKTNKHGRWLKCGQCKSAYTKAQKMEHEEIREWCEANREVFEAANWECVAAESFKAGRGTSTL